MHFTQGGERDLAAHRVTPIVIEVGTDGKVRGIMSEAGCKISGLGAQFVQPQIASIDVTVTGCVDSRFDGRYSGHLTAFAAAREGKLSLSLIRNIGPGKKIEQASIQAVLRR